MADEKVTKQSIPIVTTARSIPGSTYFTTSTVYNATSIRDKGIPFAGYRNAVKHGVNATTPLSGVKETVSPSSYTLTSGITGGTRYEVRGTHIVIPPAFGTTPTSVEQLATVAFIGNAQEAQQQWSAPTFFGELRETVKMIRHPMSAIAERTKAYRRRVRQTFDSKGRPKPGREAAGVLSDYYLAWQFGVKPLLSDVQSAAEAFADIAAKNETKTCKGSHTEVINIEVPVTNHFMNGEFLPGNARVVTLVTEEHSCRIKGAVILKHLNNASLPAVSAQRLGFGLDNFLPTLYDLFPFSFVLDYFTNVGDLVQAYSAYRQEYAWSCKTIRIVQTTRSQIKQIGPPAAFPPGNYGYVGGGQFNSTRTYFKRSAGVPPLGFPTIDLKVPSLGQTLNLGALVNSLIVCRSAY